MVGDTDWACDTTRRMWVKIGRLLEKKAVTYVTDGYPDRGIKCAKLADVCFWQATGEQGSLQWKDITPASDEAAA